LPEIYQYSDEYTSLYEKCIKKIECDANTSLEGYLLKGLSKLSSGAGKIVERIPVVSKSQLDENLIKAGCLIEDANKTRAQNMVRMLFDSQTDYIGPFLDNIQIIDNLYNRPVNLMFDEKYIYIGEVSAA